MNDKIVYYDAEKNKVVELDCGPPQGRIVFREEQKTVCPSCGTERLNGDIVHYHSATGTHLLTTCWPCLVTLPARLIELERKVAGLEAALASRQD